MSLSLCLMVRNEEEKLPGCLQSAVDLANEIIVGDTGSTGRTKTSTGEVTTFTYDFRNRLTEVLIKSSGGTTLQDDKFTYDIENRRIGKNTLSGGQSWTGYDGVNPYADFNSSGSLTFQYLYGDAINFLLARLNTSFDPTWYLTDKLGSVRLVVNKSGSVIDTISYDSYGNITNETSPSNGDRFKFTGREWDSEIGQYFQRARYYNPGAGRFLSEDPLTLVGGDTNFYRYVLNQPTRSGDPMGLFVPPVGPIILPRPWQLPGFAQQMMARGQASIAWNRFFMPPPRPSLLASILPTGSAGIQLGAQAEAGLGFTGANTQVGVGVGLFNNGTSVRPGGYVTGGSSAYFWTSSTGTATTGGIPPGGVGTPIIAGANMGVGGGPWISNATRPPQLSGPFNTTTVTCPGLSGQANCDPTSGIWQQTLSIGPTLGGGYSNVSTISGTSK